MQLEWESDHLQRELIPSANLWFASNESGLGVAHCADMPALISVWPEAVLDVGGQGILVNVRLPAALLAGSTPDAFCVFDDEQIPATPGESPGELLCVVPRHVVGLVALRVVYGQLGTLNSVPLRYTAECATGVQCPDDRGWCSYSSCVCIVPFHGLACAEEMLPPTLDYVEDVFDLTESEAYSHELTVLNGTAPLTWQVNGDISSLSLRGTNLTWADPVCSTLPYTINVVVENAVGTATASWNISVPCPYTPTLDPFDPQIVSSPSVVQIWGSLTAREGSGIAAQDVVLIIERNGIAQRVNTRSDGNGRFSYPYFITHGGSYEIYAAHPRALTPDQPKPLLAVALSRTPLRTILRLLTSNETITSEVATVVNSGPLALTGLTVSFVSVGNYARSVDEIFGIQDFSATLNVSVLEPGNAAKVYVSFIAVNGSTDSFGLRVQAANQPAATVVQVSTSLRDPAPPHAVIEARPSRLRCQAIIGRPNLFTVSVTNTGDEATGPMSVFVNPDEPIVTLVSPIVPFNLRPGDVISITISVLPNATYGIGRFRDRFVLQSDSTQHYVPMNIALVTSRLTRLIVDVTDELSYLGEGSPGLADAIVSINNPLTSFSQTLRTNSTGQAVFEGLNEGPHYVSTQALEHEGERRVVVVEGDEIVEDIFLFFATVSYMFTVTPTTFQDRYVFTLDIEFTTRVPIPVVTIVPALIDLDEIQFNGFSHIINFVITNHGLIRADNLDLSLPTGHPTIAFEPLMDLPEDGLPANTSIVVPVLVHVDPTGRRLRRQASCYSACLRYCYECNG